MTKEIMDDTYEEGINFFIYTFLSKHPMLKAIWNEEIVSRRCEDTHSLLETIYDRMTVKDNSHIEFRLCEHCGHSSLWFGILDEKEKTLNDIGGIKDIVGAKKAPNEKNVTIWMIGFLESFDNVPLDTIYQFIQILMLKIISDKKITIEGYEDVANLEPQDLFQRIKKENKVFILDEEDPEDQFLTYNITKGNA